jgi:hypothetical protein
MEFRNQVIGLIRFSYPADSGFLKTPKDRAEREAFLYDPARLERRFALFKAVCLPSLVLQTDPDFTMIFLIGDSFPESYRQRLTDMVAPIPGAWVMAQPSMDNYRATLLSFNSVSSGTHTHRTTFRLDDDDGLGLGFVQRLKSRAAKLFDPDHPNMTFCIAYNKGYYLVISPDGNRVFDACERLPLSAGLSLVTPIDRPGNIYQHDHRSVAAFRNCWTDATMPSYIRTVHQDSDAGLHVNGVKDLMTQDQIACSLRMHFANDLETLLAL